LKDFRKNGLNLNRHFTGRKLKLFHVEVKCYFFLFFLQERSEANTVRFMW